MTHTQTSGYILKILSRELGNFFRLELSVFSSFEKLNR